MIFIGPELSDAHAHFVTNIVACIGMGDDLVIDLHKVNKKEDVYEQITTYLQNHDDRFVIYNAYEDENFFIEFKQRFPGLYLLIFFSDDEWRHSNYDRYLALYSTVFTIAAKNNLHLYHEYGLKPFYMQWACNPAIFHPLPMEKKYDVTFIGAAYGKRIEYIKFLIDSGVDVRVFGHGWDAERTIRPHWGGYLSVVEMLEVINSSVINLNFLWTSSSCMKRKNTHIEPSDDCDLNNLKLERDTQINEVNSRFMIKGRSLELPACMAFQLCNFMSDLENYGFKDEENIAVFRNKHELLEKINYYLSHEMERKKIAKNSYEHVINNHTWKKRFNALFEKFDKKGDEYLIEVRKYSILVIVQDNVDHQIKLGDERLNIKIIGAENNWKSKADNVDGVIYLKHDSTINNESLYMMAFGLVVDKTDMIAANFYIASSHEQHWIRFKDILMENRRKLLLKLPNECFMFSGKFAYNAGCKLPCNLGESTVSYIEYPSFELYLPYLPARKLRLYFGRHRNSRQRFIELIRRMRFGKALSLGADKIWQKILKI